ncbi:MAG: hypothetical protein GXP29_08075 [Planctomycetes bacterium]|nr:hypothetical protein [Planctomycetota bacterium]
MKFLVGLVLVVGIGYGALHYLLSFDPAQQAKDARAAVKPGMPWGKVVSSAGEPRKCRFYFAQKKMLNGVEVEIIKPGTLTKFDKNNLGQRMRDETLPYGFEFFYNFSAESAFFVKFDGVGDVEHVYDAPTMNDLLDL